jgi:hypothetical protein
VHQLGVFFHVARPPWQPGQPLLCWDRLITAGIRSDADWQHPKVAVGYGGHLIALHQMLSGARQWARSGETIVRVRIPQANLADIRSNSEEYYCYPNEIPAAWLEVVGESETDWTPSER